MIREINRHLQLWRYSVSHSQLLLMSPRSDTEATRVYVVLKGVSFLSTTSSFSCHSVEIEGGVAVDGGAIAESGDRIRVQMRSPEGIQAFEASAIYFGEDRGEYGAPIPIGIW